MTVTALALSLFDFETPVLGQYGECLLLYSVWGDLTTVPVKWHDGSEVTVPVYLDTS